MDPGEEQGMTVGATVQSQAATAKGGRVAFSMTKEAAVAIGAWAGQTVRLTVVPDQPELDFETEPAGPGPGQTVVCELHAVAGDQTPGRLWQAQAAGLMSRAKLMKHATDGPDFELEVVSDDTATLTIRNTTLEDGEADAALVSEAAGATFRLETVPEVGDGPQTLVYVAQEGP